MRGLRKRRSALVSLLKRIEVILSCTPACVAFVPYGGRVRSNAHPLVKSFCVSKYLA